MSCSEFTKTRLMLVSLIHGTEQRSQPASIDQEGHRRASTCAHLFTHSADRCSFVSRLPARPPGRPSVSVCMPARSLARWLAVTATPALVRSGKRNATRNPANKIAEPTEQESTLPARVPLQDDQPCRESISAGSRCQMRSGCPPPSARTRTRSNSIQSASLR